MAHWNAEHIPDQSGRVAIVTGANSGLGYETTRALARKGARVVMACRNLKRGQQARDRILQRTPGAALDLLPLDLGSLEAVRAFAAKYRAAYQRLDLLINNAGVMAPPRRETADGFEMQFGVNHLGHFALTGLLLDLLVSTPGSRVVTVSSTAAYYGRINFDDLQGEKRYSRYQAYGQSKLANLLFAFELQRRLAAASSGTISNGAHPGLAETNLQARAASDSGNLFERGLYTVMHALVSQGAELGALPQLYAATAPDAEGGALYGPRVLHVRGYPRRVRPPGAARNKANARRLWERSETLSGVTYGLGE